MYRHATTTNASISKGNVYLIILKKTFHDNLFFIFKYYALSLLSGRNSVNERWSQKRNIGPIKKLYGPRMVFYHVAAFR